MKLRKLYCHRFVETEFIIKDLLNRGEDVWTNEYTLYVSLSIYHSNNSNFFLGQYNSLCSYVIKKQKLFLD